MPIIERSTHYMIRLSLRGCTNRPFFHVVVMKNRQGRDKKVTDQVGSYDPIPNKKNEQLVAIDFERIRMWMAKGAICSQPVEILLGLAGYFPIHPRTKLKAFRITREREEKQRKKEELIENQKQEQQQTQEAAES